jgi:hypothetical protein
MRYEESINLYISKVNTDRFVSPADGYEQGYKDAVQEATNILFSFGGDEFDKKMMVRDLMNQFKTKRG